MPRRLYHFSGTVQGVGFRYTVSNLARRYDVTGYVKNLIDGRVELLVEGSDTDIDSLVREIQQEMSSYIKDTRRQDQPATGEFRRFTIAH